MRVAAAVPHRGQCLLPMTIIPRQKAHDTVANLASQYLHCESSAEVAAPHIGQLTVPASTSAL